VLDVNIGGTRVDPAAEAIAARGIPVVFATGYGRNGVTKSAPGRVVERPYDSADLEQALARALS
jgi:hypothetical protein